MVEVISVRTNDEATGGSHEPFATVIPVAGGETIRVEPSRRGITLTNGDRWQQRLTREEAWRLAEAIDAVATSAGDD